MPNVETRLNRPSSFIDTETRTNIMNVLQALDHPTSLGVYLCLKYFDDVSACSHAIDPHLYCDADDFRRAYVAASILSKYSKGPVGHDERRRLAAKEKFYNCEERLRVVSARFRNPAIGFSPRVLSMLEIARKKIAKILGDPTDPQLEDLFAFGPGSSSSIKRRKAHPANKFLAADVSSAALPFLQYFFADGLEPRPCVRIQESSRVEFVPKNFKIDRMIAIEPDWNIFFQKGFGALIRKRLRSSVHLDLDHAAYQHHALARMGSLDGSLATIDLSSASDSIATSLIRYLLPDSWFVVLNSLRTDRVEIDNEVVPLRKFSSMGNGFTFELESLVFYALAFSAIRSSGCSGRLSVFGDDIILPTGACEDLFEVLQAVGFVVNTDKSYVTGLFRESCGGHFFNGEDVKPFYVKDPLSHDFERFKFCNNLRRACHRFYHHDVRDSYLFRAYDAACRRIRRVFRIPEGFGDGGLVSYFDEVTPSCSRKLDPDIRPARFGIEGFHVRALIPVSRDQELDHDGMMLYKLRRLRTSRRSSFHDQLRDFSADWRQVDVRPEAGNTVVPSSKARYRVAVMFVSRWLDPGRT